MRQSEELAKNIRVNTLNMTKNGKSSHIGAIFSCVDIIAVLYANILKYRANETQWYFRDRFILSKGHAGAGVYAALAEVGFFKKEILLSHYLNGSKLSGHVSHVGVPGVEMSTGSLGHGLSVGAGMALAQKIDCIKSRVFVLMGDGECNEGSVWEAALFSSHFCLSNLVVIIDRNRLQSLDDTENTIALEPFADKWKAFNWDVLEINGHNHQEIENALSVSSKKEKPLVIIANTTKGKGVSFMENSVLWHYRSPQGEEYIAAMKELQKEK